jgi:hypothetical protein
MQMAVNAFGKPGDQRVPEHLLNHVLALRHAGHMMPLALFQQQRSRTCSTVMPLMRAVSSSWLRTRSAAAAAAAAHVFM